MKHHHATLRLAMVAASCALVALCAPWNAAAESVYGENLTDVPIPDEGSWVFSAINITGAPADAVVTSVDVYFRCVHTYSGDLQVSLLDPGYSVQYDIWAFEGGGADNPSRTVTGITDYTGLPVNGMWRLYAIDGAALDVGYIDEWWIQIGYTSGGSNSYAVYGMISDFEGTDIDSDGYYEAFNYLLGVDADAIPGPASVVLKLICTTTGQDWWSVSPWVVTGDEVDWVYFYMDESYFAGLLGEDMLLDFTLQIWDPGQTTLLAENTTVLNEPVPAESYMGSWYAVGAEITNFTGTDSNGNGYYESCNFYISVDADAVPGPVEVAARVVCPTTGQWWTSSPWTVTGSAVDYQNLIFNSSYFAGHAYGETALDFTVEVWDPTFTLKLASTQYVANEPVNAEFPAPTQTLVFDPNPVNTLNDSSLADDSDANTVPSSAYQNVSLTRLNAPIGGLYRLQGSFAWLTNLEDPANTTPTSTSTTFPYLRAADAFEEVMCYYHISRNQEYIQSLGFTGVNNRAIQIDAHGLSGADNSHYVGSPIGAGYMAFGDGGVDDAEDADVILHEYGHAIQDNQTTGLYFGTGDVGYGDETGAMGEGFGDYWAASNTFDQSISNGFDPAVVGEWDAVPFGIRRVDGTKHYPQAMVNQVHADGEIWSACLWEMLYAIGKEATDTLVLLSHYYVPPDPTFRDGAEAILAADFTMYAGAHSEEVRSIFVARGILPADDNYEPNNDMTEAYWPGYSWDGIWLSSINGPGRQFDDDWYAIVVGDGALRVTVDCTFTHDEGDIDVWLTDATGGVLGYSAGVVDNEHIDVVVPEAGLYFIVVTYGNQGNAYDLMYTTGLPVGPVPDVVGMEQSAAGAAVVAAGFFVDIVDYELSNTVAAGHVIAQDPTGGTSAALGSGVNLTISLGPPIEVPDVTGMLLADAEAAILAANLTIGFVDTAYSDTVPAGHVIAQMPFAGEMVEPETAVLLLVSLGPEMGTVPTVVGLAQATAESTIVAAGFTVGVVTTAHSDTVPAGAVISQQPVGGASAPLGSPVDLVLSLGPDMITVPNVVGMHKFDAEDAIAGADLNVGATTWVFSDVVPAYQVMSQNPGAGASVPAGTAVNITVCLPAIFVDKANTSIEDGLYWSTAFNTIQEGIGAAVAMGIPQVWVKAGVYNEPRFSNLGVETGSLVLAQNVGVYGGFSGFEVELHDRDFATNITVIDGATSRGGQPALHVVWSGEGARLDGFTVRGGNCVAAVQGTVDIHSIGAGYIAWGVSGTVANCIFEGNTAEYGGAVSVVSCLGSVENCTFRMNDAVTGAGGVFSFNASATVSGCRFESNAGAYAGALEIWLGEPVFEDCTFTSNHGVYGGGVFSWSSTVSFVDCVIDGNNADLGAGGAFLYESDVTAERCVFTLNDGFYGGALSNWNTALEAVNCLVAGNTAYLGGAMFSTGCDVAATHCTIAGNTAAAAGGGLFNSDSSCLGLNCILWGNAAGQVYQSGTGASSFEYTDIQDGWAGAGNIDQAPLFMGGGDYRLMAGSPCENAANPAAAPDDDLDGNPRPVGAGPDMGAYERQ